MLGNLLGLAGFALRDAPKRCAPKRSATPTTLAARLRNDAALRAPAQRDAARRAGGLERIADVPIYCDRPASCAARLRCS